MSIPDKIAILDELVHRGANINARCIRGWTALHYAVHQRETEVVQALLRLGTMTNLRDIYGRTALQLHHEVPDGDVSCRESLQNVVSQSRFEENYSVVCPSIVRVGEPLAVTYRTRADHSSSDYIQVYYCLPTRITMSPRMGSYQYVPEGSAEGIVYIDTRSLSAGWQLRALYVFGDLATPVCASDIVEVYNEDDDDNSTVESDTPAEARDAAAGLQPPHAADEAKEDAAAQAPPPVVVFPLHAVPQSVRDLLPDLEASASQHLHHMVVQASLQRNIWNRLPPHRFVYEAAEWDELRTALVGFVPELEKVHEYATTTAGLESDEFWRRYLYSTLQLVLRTYGVELDARYAAPAAAHPEASSSGAGTGEEAELFVAKDAGEPQRDEKGDVILTVDLLHHTQVPDTFVYDLGEHIEDARVALQSWPSLDAIRFKLVPARLSEEVFWRTFAYLLETFGTFSATPPVPNRSDAI